MAYCVVKTVKSEVIAMWDEWDKELEAVKKKKKSGTMNGFGCLFLMPGPFSLPFFPERSCPNLLD